jgi:hypothetical protein
MIMRHYILVGILLLLATAKPLTAQEGTPVECGMILEDELTENLQVKQYVIEMAPGDELLIRGAPIGDSFKFVTAVHGPTGILINVSSDESGRDGWVSANPTADTGVLSARGNYTIRVGNSWYRSDGSLDNRNSFWGGVGIYTLFIGCTLRDGTVIEPGDAPPTNTGNGSASTPTFSGVGFPGLAPVDFANAVKLPLIAGAPMTGAITPTGGEILGFQVEASAGDVLDLSLSRLSGNLHLGLVVLSSENQVVSYGGLISGDTFSTRITLPSAGQYTIGVFRIDLLPPADPQATAFQVAGTLNS